MHSLVPLNLLAVGQVGIVREIVGDAQHVHRLDEIGLRRGCAVEVLQAGRPCIIRLTGQTFCFRDDEQTRILVELENAA
jgi:ferrous iron transport protein A